jgi:hypothetical protein
MINYFKKKTTILVLAFVIFSFASCKKDAMPVGKVERTIRFVLYTDQNFSNEDRNIIFSVFIRRDGNYPHLFDSTFSVMKVKEIPGASNKIVFEKKVLVDASLRLGAGFVYSLENVGYSWYIEACEPGELFKEINYSFQ